MEFFRQLWQQLRAIYAGMSWARRGVVLGATVGCLALLAGLVAYSNQQDYRLLYSSLAADDAGAITAKLQSRSVPYRLASGGTSVYVPAEQMAQLRLDFASEGLPSKGKGYELFDTPNFGRTPFEEHVSLDRALQGELARTLTGIEPILSARVHLVRPNPSPFIRDSKPATASVVLKLKPGTTLGAKTATGITALVAHSVEGLAADQVTLLDSRGQLLSKPEGDQTGLVPSQIEYRHKVESDRARQAEEMLAAHLGAGRAIVRVTAEMNFQKQKSKKVSFDPEARVARKETVAARKNSSTQAARGGIAGAGSNLPTGGRLAGTPPAPAGNSENEETTETEYDTSRTEVESEENRGTIDRLTIAALVDLSQPEGGTGRTLTPADVEEIIKQATGFKKGRDEIKVNDVKLLIAASPEGPPEGIDGNGIVWYTMVARNVSLMALVVVGLLLAVQYYRRQARTKKLEEFAAARPEPSPEDSQDREAAERLIALAEANPEGLAQLLISWLDESSPEAALTARAA